jgi:cation diffusion facilitator family transporter
VAEGRSEAHGSVVAAIASNVAIAVAKLVVAGLTGSSAMLSEAIHSLVDTGNGGLLWIGMRRARRPPDAAHPFGHGMELYFWTTVVSILVFAVGGGMSVYEGVSHLLAPAPASSHAWSYAVLAISAAFEGSSWLVAAREFARTKRDNGVWEEIRTIVLNLELELRGGLSVGDTAAAVTRIEDALEVRVPDLRYVFIEGRALGAPA